MTISTVIYCAIGVAVVLFLIRLAKDLPTWIADDREARRAGHWTQEL